MDLSNVEIDAESGTVEYMSAKFLYISASRKLKINKSLDYDAVLIDGKSVEFVKMILKRIRGNANPLIYLKPVILVNGNSHRDLFVNKLIDGVIYSFDQISMINDAVAEINELVNSMNFINSISFEANTVAKLICFMYSRGRQYLSPVPYTQANTNYTFPILACNYNFDDEHKVFDILRICESEGILKGKFSDRVYLCPGCKSSQLSYRETCPKCSSSNTSTSEIIHHFPCAYVGPISDFSNELDDTLYCPKCTKRLRHIGVDYDKPSVLHTCNNCDNRFQDFFVKAKCMSCGKDSLVESLVDEEIAEYTLTKKGEMYAVQGYVSTPKDIEDIIGTVKFDTFKTVVRYEVERLRQTDGSSNIVALSITNAGQFYAKVDLTKQKNLLKDMVAEIRSSIRSSDMITFYSSSVILITMFEIPNKVAQNFMKDIVKLLEELIERNFRDLRIELASNIEELNITQSFEVQVNHLTEF
jgi:hypothetical protein